MPINTPTKDQIKIRYTLSKNGTNEIAQQVFTIADLEIQKNNAFSIFKESGTLIGRDLSVNHFDKNGVELFGNDIVEGYWSRMKGDGYLKKGYPKKIRKWFKLVCSDGKVYKAGWALDEICVHPEDQKYDDRSWYRRIDVSLREDYTVKNNEIIWDGINRSIEKIGDIYTFKK